MIRLSKKLTGVFLLCILLFSLSFTANVKAASTIDSFVTRLYELTLDREPDPSGFQYWTTSLSSNKSTASGVLKEFVFSTEFTGKNLPDDQYVTVLYKLIMDRMPDTDGLNYWTSLLGMGHSRLNVLANFVNSTEFINLAKNAGITPGVITLTAPVDVRVDLSEFVTKFYKQGLNRAPVESELNSYVSGLAAKNITAAKLTESILLSQEFVDKNISDEDFIKVAYQCLFNRDPNQSEHDTWIKSLNDGYSRRYVLAQLIQTNEFKALCTKYNIVLGNISYDAMDSRPDLKNFVTRFYTYALGRQPDYNGLKYYVSGLAAKNTTAADLANTIFFSPEFIGDNINSNDYVTKLYKCFFDRDPDPDGLNNWLNALLNGYSRKYLLANFVNSTEFQNLASKYNVNRGQLSFSTSDTPYNGTINAMTITDVNLRTAPSLSSQVIRLIPMNSKLVIVSRAPSFYFVRILTSDNKLIEGYCWDDYIQPYTDDTNNDMLGVLSEKYESNGDPGAISTGSGDVGGKSYGVWQLSSNAGSVTSFLNWLSKENVDFYNTLNAARIQDGNTFGVNFDNAWKSIAANNYDAFYQVQHKYIKLNYYDSLVKKLTAAGAYDRLLSSFAVRNVLWSTAVQHGVSGAYGIISKFLNITDNLQFINAIYDERSKLDVYFPGCSTDVLNGLATRFKNERNDAVNIYNNEISYRK